MTDRENPPTSGFDGRNARAENELRDLARSWQAELDDINAREHSELEDWARERMRWTRYDPDHPGEWRKFKDGYDPTRLGARLGVSWWRWMLGLPPKQF
jgi:hypothetical protein